MSEDSNSCSAVEVPENGADVGKLEAFDPPGGGSSARARSDSQIRSGGEENFPQWMMATEWAAAMGLPEQAVRDAASTLMRGTTKVGRGGALLVNAAARAALWVHFGLDEVLPPGAEKTAPKTVLAEPEVLTVLKSPINVRILLCAKNDGAVVRVRVRDNRLFVPRKTVRARLEHVDRPDLYVLTSRHPKKRGDHE